VVRRRLADGSVKEYRYARTTARPSRIAPGSLDALIVAYKRSPEWAAKAKATQATYRIYLRDLDAAGIYDATKITRRMILAWRDAIASERGNGAAQGAIRAWSALFTWAVDRQWIDASPCHRIKALPSGALPAWTAAQADHALAKLPEAFRRVVLLARHTGQRRGDLVRLTWASYDGQSLRLRQQKTKAVLRIPCAPALRAELDHWKAAATSTHILTSPRGVPWQPEHLSHQLPQALQAIGLPPGLNVHGLRKLAAATLADAGCSTHEIAAITGHRTLAMLQHYTLTADQERLAVSAIDRLKTPSGKRVKTPRK
jgi:integrase